MSSNEGEFSVVQCNICNNKITSKPWISTKADHNTVHGCSYLCSKKLSEKVGPGYWKNVINKEDFCELRPVYGFNTHKINKKKDITAGFGMDEIRKEIEDENQTIELFDYDYDYFDYSDYSDDDYELLEDDYFDEENYY